MNTPKLLSFSIVAAGTITGSLLMSSQPAQALTMHNGWNYSIDAKNDSTPFKRDGSGLFEIYGIAHRVIGDTVIMAINSNVNLRNGVRWNDAADRRVDFADILLNFTGKSLDEANGQLFGIRFAANNDSGVSGLGLYKDVVAKSVASTNSGYDSLGDYSAAVLAKGVTPTIGDLVYDDPYFDPSKQTLTSIASGTKIQGGDLRFISNFAADPILGNIGLDFGYFGKTGSETIAFTFDAGLLPQGEALYHLALECNNDMVAGYYNEVPTPAAILPSILGLFGIASRNKKQEETV